MKVVHESASYFDIDKMTRKCVLCKETNYKNTYSFFSAPKDPETRKKWQDAIAIDNYSVTDETYVCSKHFHKSDIITHWVSGVPPHVITIKYKKCRLRPGAVPGRDLEENNQINLDCSDDSDLNMSDYLMFKSEEGSGQRLEKRTFSVPRTEARHKLEMSNSMDTEYSFSSQFEESKFSNKERKFTNKTISLENLPDSNYTLKPDSTKMEVSDNSSQESCNIIYLKKETKAHSNSENNVDSEIVHNELNLSNKQIADKNKPQKNSESSRICSQSDVDDTSTEPWDQRKHNNETQLQEKCVSDAFDSMDDVCKESYTENHVLSVENYDSLDTHYYSLYNECEENEMLFEDLLEVCSEILLPRGWSSLVTSKGHTTTVVYLYMGMTKTGMPFAEKQVFVKSDMILRCAAVNREINPLIHNLIRDGKHLKVHSLLDVEELIDEFDQRVVCQGIYNVGGLHESGIRFAYKDGVKWRHVLCPLILNNDSTRCTKCVTLTHMMARKSTEFIACGYSLPVFIKGQQKLYRRRQIRKLMRKHDRRHNFITTFKK